MPTNAYFKTLFQLDKSSPRFSDQLRDLLDGGEFGKQLSSLQTDEVVKVIDYLDEVLSLC